MRWVGLSLALSFLLAGTSPSGSAPAVYTISGIDPGGQITAYTERYQALEKTGVTVQVDGLCVSACTLVLAIFPPSRVCMTDRGSFGFHLASGDAPDPELTKAWLRLFPEWVLDWIASVGGVQDEPKYAFAEDFKGHIQLCPGSVYRKIDMNKLIHTDKPSDTDGGKIIFTPHE